MVTPSAGYPKKSYYSEDQGSKLFRSVKTHSTIYMTNPFNDIPAKLLSDLTVVYSEKQRKHVYAVLGQNA